MKRILLPAIVISALLFSTSCGSSSSFESDVKKMANYQCKMQQLMAKDQNDEKIKKEIADLTKEAEAFAQKMEEKYKADKDNAEMEAKAEAIVKEVMEKCK